MTVLSSVSQQAQAWVRVHPGEALNLFALADPAMDRTSAMRLAHCATARLSLLAGVSAPEDLSPQLLWLGPADHPQDAVAKTLQRGMDLAAYSLICSPLPLASLQSHLAAFVDVRLPGDHDMLLALWDPAILGTMVGQSDDETLHVPGPALTADQRHALLGPIAFWWYADRESHWHRIDGAGQTLVHDAVPPQKRLQLDQSQEDALVEASVPDQILFHLRQNRPSLLNSPDLPNANYHRFVHEVLKGARALGLEGMRDLVNFVALCLIYRQRVETDPQILQLLDQVRRKNLTMDDAMKRMPE